MTTQSTPGHKGKLCAVPEYWRGTVMLQWRHEESPQWRVVERRDGYPHILWVHNCPACGMLLECEEEPLPVPEGFEWVTKRVVKTTRKSYVITARVSGYLEAPYLMLSCDNPKEAHTIWRRLFGKEKE